MRIVALLVALLAFGCNHTVNPHVWTGLETETPSYTSCVLVKAKYTGGAGAVVACRGGYWWVITAAHVVIPPLGLEVDGRPADIEALSAKNDLALVKFRSVREYKPYQLARASVGQRCHIVGYPKIPEGGEKAQKQVVSVGHVGRIADGRIWANAGVCPGFSGAAMLDNQGRLLGIMNTLVIIAETRYETLAAGAESTQIAELMKAIP